jgi:transposase-like protein
MPSQYPDEFRDRAVRLVAESRHSHESEWAAIRGLRKENAELRRANEILQSASAFFAARLDRTATR